MEITFEKVREEIADLLGIDPQEITPKSQLQEDLGAGSFDLVDLVVTFEEKYNVRVEAVDFNNIKTVQDVYEYVNKLLKNNAGIAAA